MGDPKVSVCIPTYNHEKYLAQAVESALAQRTDFPVEIHIGEDCSTDRTREIALEIGRHYPDRICLHLAEKNQGGGHNFCNLFAHIRGQYAIILEGDDYWTSSSKLQAQVDALDARPDWAMCFHPARAVYDDGRPAHFYPDEPPKDEWTIDDLFIKNFMATSSVLFRNRLFDRLPDWFPDVIVGDWALHILNAAHGKIGFLSEPMSVYRVHQGGVFSCKSLEYKLVTIFRMLSKVDHHFGGMYVQEIEQNRLHTVQWLVGQMEREARRSKESAAREEQLVSKMAQLEADAAKSSAEFLVREGQLAGKVARLEEDAVKSLAEAAVREGRLASKLTQLETDAAESTARNIQLIAALARVEDRSAELQTRIYKLDSDLSQMGLYTAYLESERERLLREMEPLNAFYDSWHKSPLYRIYRETVRPWHQLRRRLWATRAEPIEEPQVPQVPPSQNAA